jgi:FRG domain
MAKKKTGSRPRYRSLTARSLSDFVDIVQDLQDEWSDLEVEQIQKDDGEAHIWFRGNADKTWELTPKIFRTTNEISVKDEAELYGEFLRRAYSLAPSLTAGWHSYFLMQHHGIPTRLLDWTDSALTALYFAIRNSKTDAAVWAVNPLWLNGKTVNRYALVEPSLDPMAVAFMVDAVHASIEDHKEDGAARLLSIAVRPPWVSMRMFAQRSLFTLHGAQNIPIEQYPFVRRNSPLCRIVIPVKQREDFLVGLRSCGVTETTIYPDLDGLAKELITEYGGLDVPK